MPVLIVLGACAVVLVYIFSTYNRFQTTLTRITASIQEIGNQLKRQVDLIPNLETAAKSYLKHEKEIYRMLRQRFRSFYPNSPSLLRLIRSCAPRSRLRS